jgi:formylglycine-generating enzyme required for sulfatase activity
VHGEKRSRQEIGRDTEDLDPILSSEDEYRVARGGGFANARGEVRCASRDKYVPFMVNDAMGFRVARTLAAKESEKP